MIKAILINQVLLRQPRSVWQPIGAKSARAKKNRQMHLRNSSLVFEVVFEGLGGGGGRQGLGRQGSGPTVDGYSPRKELLDLAWEA